MAAARQQQLRALFDLPPVLPAPVRPQARPLLFKTLAGVLIVCSFTVLVFIPSISNMLEFRHHAVLFHILLVLAMCQFHLSIVGMAVFQVFPRLIPTFYLYALLSTPMACGLLFVMLLPSYLSWAALFPVTLAVLLLIGSSAYKLRFLIQD